MNKNKKINKIKKIGRFRPSAVKITLRLEDEYYGNGENDQIRKIYDNFRFSVHILAKIFRIWPVSPFLKR